MVRSEANLNASQAAAYVGVSRPTMLRALAAGAVPAMRLGRRWVISRKALDLVISRGLLATESPTEVEALPPAVRSQRVVEQ